MLKGAHTKCRPLRYRPGSSRAREDREHEEFVLCVISKIAHPLEDTVPSRLTSCAYRGMICVHASLLFGGSEGWSVVMKRWNSSISKAENIASDREEPGCGSVLGGVNSSTT